ncbi:unnamed protein product [Rotaria socialis]|uniref:Uncharacterized protein n=1 Tax=Rotaria socialis TaxID=392032 RepID=A0A818LAB1_9BILA|nr:unnamed protein product [Rotaria socialis]CAF4876456.1 unnamed protein product [Rotaria socialis]
MSPILYCSICLGFILCYSIATKIDVEGQSSLINRYDERSITSDKRNNIFNSPFHGLLKKTKNENNIRRRRDETHNVDMKAVVAKLEDHRTMINDHRTMIDDHRTMINNFNNNSIHVDTIQQAISKHHSSAPPVWNSWRDILLIFFVLIIIILIFYFCLWHVKLRPFDFLLSCMIQRYTKKQKDKEQQQYSQQSTEQQQYNQQSTEHIHHPMKSNILSTYPKLSIKTIESDYAKHQDNRKLANFQTN